METRKILIACTGSVATIKLGEIIQRLQSSSHFKFEVKTPSIFAVTNFLNLILIPDQNNGHAKCQAFHRTQ